MTRYVPDSNLNGSMGHCQFRSYGREDMATQECVSIDICPESNPVQQGILWALGTVALCGYCKACSCALHQYLLSFCL